MKSKSVKMNLEICANSYKSAINAQKAGAHRIELCSELAVGGITPSYGMIKQVVNSLKIPVYVLIRPRSSNFTYSDNEFNIMKQDILICKELGCQGIVSGILNRDNTIDIEKTQELVALTKPLSFTFHRAFDCVINPFESIKELKKIEVDRVLTSGQNTSAEKGIKRLIELKDKVNNSISIMPGGGINSENVKLFKNAGFREFHCSASTLYQVNEIPKVSMNSQKLFDERIVSYSEIDKIKAILNNINN